VNYHSAEHICFLNKARQAKQTNRKLEKLQHDQSAINSAWNEQRLRFGDKVGHAIGNSAGCHPNTWDIATVSRNAWKQIGKSRLIRSGIDGMHRALSVLATVASVLQYAQTSFVSNETQDLIDSGSCPVINRFYDATPIRVAFGQLQQQVYPHARYSLQVDDTKWIPVSYAEYQKNHPERPLPRFGTLELLGQGATCFYADAKLELHGFRIISPPVFLQRGNASTLHRACEDAIPQLSFESGLHRIAAHAKYGIVSELPDACSANNRKKAKAFSMLPSNIFGVNGQCGCHQCHRVVESSEKDMIGNVHAVHVTCTLCHNQTKMQVRFRELLREVDFKFGVPPHDYQQRNREMLERTIIRRSIYIIGDGLRNDDALVAAADRFLKYWNGDWTYPRVSHYCQGEGCCADEENCRDNMYATALSIDLLQSRDVETPSMDDWGSCGEACGKTCAGILIHDVLRRTLEFAFPTWSTMLPPNDADRPLDTIEHARQKAQKKAWRAKSFLSDAFLQVRCVLLCFFGAPVECLMAELQYQDGASRGLLDVLHLTDSNFFLKARRNIMNILSLGTRGPVAYLLNFYPNEMHFGIISEARAMACNFASQIWWRFLHLSDYPYQFGDLANRTLDAVDRFAIVKTFFALEECCRNKEFSAKVYAIFKDAVEPAKSLFHDVDFAHMMVAYVFVFKFTNMWSERLLSLVRRSCRDDGDMERICASGFLAQVLAEHIRLGGADPRCPTREHLLAEGVPLRCAKKMTTHRSRGSFINWMMKAEDERRDAGIKLPKAAYREWQKVMAGEFEQLDSEQRDLEHEEASASFAATEVEREKDASDAAKIHPDDRGAYDLQACTGLARTIVQEVGTKRTPLLADIFDLMVRSKLNLNEHAKCPGFTAYDGAFREEQRRRIFCEDAGDIPDSEKFEYYVPCTLAHPELCAKAHAWCLPQIRACAKALRAIVRDVPAGSFYALRFEGPGFELMVWVVFCHWRGSNPRLALFSPAIADYTKETVEIDDVGQPELVEFLMETTLLGRVMAVSRDQPISVVHCFPASVDRARLHSGNMGRISLLPDWEERVASSELCIYPVPPREKIAKSKEFSRMRRGLKSFDAKPTRNGAMPRGVKIVLLGGGGLVSESSESEDSRATRQPSDTDEEPGPSSAAPAFPNDAVRDSRAVAFGPWTISEIGPRSRPTGWGGNCNRHRNAGNCKKSCKKELTYGRLSPDECRCIIKKWLLMGVGIPADSPSGQVDHVRGILRHDIPLIVEHILDQEANALL
jgi:hypothetical protein